jgi:uncharacterized membrane protein YfcA
MLTQLAQYLLLGALTGVLAGLFGVGGGIIMVPALIVLFTAQGVSPDVLTHVAIGSSLATISFTSLSSVRAHHRRSAVRWPLVLRLAPGVCAGVWSGAAIAHHLSGASLQKGFGVFLVLIATQMLLQKTPRKPEAMAERLPSLPLMGAAGIVIGLLSAFFGIGGGSLTVPFLTWRGVRMQQAVATAAAVGFPIAVAGACGFVWQGWENPALPKGSTGFVYWPAVIGIAATSVFFAGTGAKWAHVLDAQKLKQYFALFLFAIGVWFLLRR